MFKTTHLHLSAVKCYRPGFVGSVAPVSSCQYNKTNRLKKKVGFTVTVRIMG